jgi:TonB family protein
METAVNYIIESSLCLGALAMLYRAWLRRNPVLWFNRIYLLLALVVSATVPLVHYSMGHSVVYHGNMLPELQVSDGYYLLDSLTVWGSQTQTSFIEKLKVLPWLKLVYLTGIILLFGKLLVGLAKIRWFKNQGVIHHHAGIVLVDMQNAIGPFSFFNILFINQQNYNPNEVKVIIDHELAHIKLKHSYDILLLELILIVQWFNPFAWLLRHDLKELHEFQADQYTLQAGTNPAHYRRLLVLQALGAQVDLGHNFSQSLIKKRLKMMNSHTNRKLGLLKPITALLLISFLVTAFGYDQAPIPSSPPPFSGDGTNTLALKSQPFSDAAINTLMPPPPPYVADTTIYHKTEVMPEFPGGLNGLSTYVMSALKYPVEAQVKGITGKVFIGFVVDRNGKVINAKVERSVHPLLDKEALRVVNEMPRWTPGTDGGDPKNVYFTLPINFALSPTTLDNEKMTIIEQMPEFPGSQAKLMEYLGKNVKYPAAAMETNQTGKAYVSFDVMEDGSVQAAKIAKSSGYEPLDNEAIRVVSAAPKWEPGRQKGEAVSNH